MFYTTDELKNMTGCLTDDGLFLWLHLAGIPISKNGKGKPQVNPMFCHMVGKAINPIQPLLEKSYSLKRVESAVYLLKNKGAIVYVGMSKVLMSRLGKHSTSKMDFDEVEVVPVPEEYALLLESELIARHKPIHNVSKTVEPPHSRKRKMPRVKKV